MHLLVFLGTSTSLGSTDSLLSGKNQGNPQKNSKTLPMGSLNLHARTQRNYETDVDPRLQSRVQRYGWDKAAPHYNRTWQRQLAPAHDAVLYAAAPTGYARVLDVACGTGAVSIPLAMRYGDDVDIIGVDLSSEMIAFTRGVAKEALLSNIRFERMDAENLDFPDACFDITICSLGLMYCPDAENAIAEMYRVTKPGGKTVCAVWGPRHACGWAEIFPITDARVKSEVCPLFFRLGEKRALVEALSRVGYQSIAEEIIETELVYENAEAACDAAFLGGPVALAYSRFSDHEKELVHAEYLASIDKFRANDEFRIPGVFIVSVAVK